jgi:hypothetical protein
MAPSISQAEERVLLLAIEVDVGGGLPRCGAKGPHDLQVALVDHVHRVAVRAEEDVDPGVEGGGSFVATEKPGPQGLDGYKIAPFLAWFHLQHRQIATGGFDIALPHVRALLPDGRARL